MDKSRSVISSAYCLLYLYDIGQTEDFSVYYSHQKKRRLLTMTGIQYPRLLRRIDGNQIKNYITRGILS